MTSLLVHCSLIMWFLVISNYPPDTKMTWLLCSIMITPLFELKMVQVILNDQKSSFDAFYNLSSVAS